MAGGDKRRGRRRNKKVESANIRNHDVDAGHLPARRKTSIAKQSRILHRRLRSPAGRPAAGGEAEQARRQLLTMVNRYSIATKLAKERSKACKECPTKNRRRYSSICVRTIDRTKGSVRIRFPAEAPSSIPLLSSCGCGFSSIWS